MFEIDVLICPALRRAAQATPQEEGKVAEVPADALHDEVKAARLSDDDTGKAVPARYSRDWPDEDDSDKETSRKPLPK
ncbi:MAG: hypothetical protein IPJ19_19785 [Planctomycetes bacterium]|nr:hypothetical protein [Planctomycetota bacterium]